MAPNVAARVLFCAYYAAGVPWSKPKCPSEASGHVGLRNGHESATLICRAKWHPCRCWKLLVLFGSAVSGNYQYTSLNVQ